MIVKTDASFSALVPDNTITCSEIDIVFVAGIHWVCRESKGLINVADKLGRSPLLAGLMAGAGLAAVTELLKQGDGVCRRDVTASLISSVTHDTLQARTPGRRTRWAAGPPRLPSSTATPRYRGRQHATVSE